MDIVERRYIYNLSSHLGLRLPVVLEYVRDFEWYGDCLTIRNKYHRIRLQGGMEEECRLTTIAHEMRHCWQYEQGYFQYHRSHDGEKIVLYRFEAFLATPELWERGDTPWEIDADNFEVRYKEFVPEITYIKGQTFYARRIR